MNSRSIGIELDNDGGSPFAAPLMKALDALLPGILGRWNIPPEGVIGHSDMAPGRKIDPGRRFDWRRLSRQGLAVWSDAGSAATDPEAFRRHATAFGYGEMDADLLRDMVRMRFRPWANGPLDGTDCAIMADLAERYGVDPAPSDA